MNVKSTNQTDAEKTKVLFAALPQVDGFAADLLNAAMSEVNWHEIATSLLEDYADEPEREDDEDEDEPAAEGKAKV